MIDAKAEPCSILFESMNWGLDKRWGHKFVNFCFNYFGGANQRYFCATWFCLGQMLFIYVSYHGHRKRTVWGQYHNLQMIWIIWLGRILEKRNLILLKTSNYQDGLAFYKKFSYVQQFASDPTNLDRLFRRTVQYKNCFLQMIRITQRGKPPAERMVWYNIFTFK